MKKDITICWDFDGVICTYDGYKGKDVFGKPILETIEVIRELKKQGRKIIIWTTRATTPKLKEWLKKHDVPYDALNSHINKLPDTSDKPFYNCIIDDRSINFNLKTSRLSKPRLLFKIQTILNNQGLK